jgi:hypothetical protein
MFLFEGEKMNLKKIKEKIGKWLKNPFVNAIALLALLEFYAEFSAYGSGQPWYISLLASIITYHVYIYLAIGVVCGGIERGMIKVEEDNSDDDNCGCEMPVGRVAEA